MGLDEFKEYNFTKQELIEAATKAEEEYQKCKQDIRDKGTETVKYIEENISKDKKLFLKASRSMKFEGFITGLS